MTVSRAVPPRRPSVTLVVNTTSASAPIISSNNNQRPGMISGRLCAIRRHSMAE